MAKWTSEQLKAQDAIELKKFKCPSCSYVNPIMDLINTANCLNCGTFNNLVENGYVVISAKNWSVLEMSEE